MNPFDIFGAYARLAKVIAIGIALAAIASAIGYGVHRYNEWIKEDLRSDVALLQTAVTERNTQIRNQNEAIRQQKADAVLKLAEETAKVKAAQDEQKAAIDAKTRKFKDEQAKSDAELAALQRDHAILRDRDSQRGEACGRGPSGGGAEGGKTSDGPGVEAAAGGDGLSPRLSSLLWALIRDTAETIKQYEYCQSVVQGLSAP